ncbi:hypothetical protein V1277_002842 [Bradyrhizobium sp. AZCC 1588]|uniref:hypothetical protein n=1 Tax=unclassified Bradyrhizobium TaxID=2631580 RepID=UPI002FEF38B1
MAEPNQPQESERAIPTPPASPAAANTAAGAGNGVAPNGGNGAGQPAGIDDDLTKLEKETWKRKLEETLKAELGPIKQKRDQVIKNYTDKKRDELVGRWKAQAAALDRVWKDINDYPNWIDIIDQCVCPTKEEIKKQADVVGGFEPKHPGPKHETLKKAKVDVEARKAELDGWLSIEQQLSKQLDDVDKAIKDVKDAYNGPSPKISLYLFWFKALPPHQSVTPNAPGAQREPPIQVDRWPRCVKWPERGKIYLIATADLQREIDAAWTQYRDARRTLAEAERDFEKSPDDLAAETKRLDELKKNEDETIRKALSDKPAP